jgi:hypothetical protein
MTTQQPKPESESNERNLVAEFVKASGFGPPPEVCRQLQKPSPENEQNIVNQVIETSGFGLAKRS